MRCQRTAIISFVLFSTLVACDLGPHSLGSQDSGTDSGIDSDTDDSNGDSSCEGAGVSASFELAGVGPGFQDLTLACAASVAATDTGYAISLSDCTDPEAMAHPDLQVQLDGEWSEPLVDGEVVELRYVAMGFSQVIDGIVYPSDPGRWLLLRKPGAEAPLPLMAIDAPITGPIIHSDIDIDFAPLAIDPVSTDCALLEHPECGPVQPGAMVVSVQDQPFEVPEGSQSSEVGFEGERYHVIVDRTRSLIDPCTSYLRDEYRLGVVALPD